MRKLAFFILLLCLSDGLHAQTEQPPFTPAAERMAAFQRRQALSEASLAKGLSFRSVGPSVFSGRAVDIDVSPDDPSHFYVAYASGGLWKTVNNGMSFTPLFDQEMVMTIGDIAVDWKNDIIWVGTGENNSSRSSYSGVGLYRSADGGKTWRHRGLEESHHIGRVVLHPNDTNTLWVAALGHLYSPNPERGLYKTTDGGETWRHTLFVNENAGAIDLILDPVNPDILYAAIWERTRRAWDFTESGPGSGIYRSSDGGETWKLLSGPGSGFPNGEGVGRIGLDIAYADGNPVLYACLDNQERRPEEPPAEEELTKSQLRAMSKADFLAAKKYLLAEFLRRNNFPAKYDADKIREMVANEEIVPATLVDYLEDANAALFDTPVIGLEIYRSDDEGQTWKKTHDKYLDGVYFSYGYYFGEIRVARHDVDKLYVLGVPILRSDDGGAAWQSINGDNVHVDHHALWVSPHRPGHLILGNDGGINISYDDGRQWIKCNTLPVGQFYAVAVDMATPYRVYGGLQDNGVWYGPSNYRAGTRWHDTGDYPYKSLLGGDGMQIAIDTRDNETVYTGFQFGNYFRINSRAGERKAITPRHELGERPWRWNWQTPIHLSIHNQDVLYMGSNKLHRSLDRGDNWQTLSEDLTTGGRAGDVAYSTLASIHESPLRFGLLYVGSDDGLVHRSRDGGFSWQLIDVGLPKDMWVSRVQASAHDEGTVYLALNGYRWDDFTPYLYRSDDFGDTWERIGLDLPLEPVNVVREDPKNPRLLYVGTDHGLYVSLDRGQSFMLLDNGLPAAPVHDLVVHSREADLLLGTHGRSLYIGSVKELQQLTPQNLERPLILFAVDAPRHNPRWGAAPVSWMEAQTPEMKIPLYAQSAGTANMSVLGEDNLVLRAWQAEVHAGLNYLPYALTYEEKALSAYERALNRQVKADEKPVKLKKADNGEFYLQKGKYKIVAEKAGQKQEIAFELK